MKRTIHWSRNFSNHTLAPLLFVLLLAWPASGHAADRTAKYSIRVLGMNIGQFTVNQKDVDEDIRIEAVTDVEVKIIFTYRVKFIQHSVYRKGLLWSSHVQTVKNGKVNSDMKLQRKDGLYELNEDGKTSVVHGNITYSGSLLYFNEPKNISVMYNERNGEKKPLKAIAEHIYIITDDKNKKTNEYEYENGVLARAELIHPMATIRLERSM